MKRQKSQLSDVLSYLEAHGSITSMDAWKIFHVTRLSSIIFRLRQLGYSITTETHSGKNDYGPYNYAKYILEEV